MWLVLTRANAKELHAQVFVETHDNTNGPHHCFPLYLKPQTLNANTMPEDILF